MYLVTTDASVNIGKHIGMILLLYHIVSRKFLRQSGYLSMIDFEDLLDYNCIAVNYMKTAKFAL